MTYLLSYISHHNFSLHNVGYVNVMIVALSKDRCMLFYIEQNVYVLTPLSDNVRSGQLDRGHYTPTSRYRPCQQ